MHWFPRKFGPHGQHGGRSAAALLIEILAQHISFIFFTVDWWQRVHPPCVGNGNISAIALLHTPRLPS